VIVLRSSKGTTKTNLQKVEIKMKNANLLNKTIKAVTIKGFEVEGKVYDYNERYLSIENEVDYYVIDTQHDTYEVIEEVQAVQEPEFEIVEDVIHMDIKQLKKEIQQRLKYAEEATAKVQVYDFEEAGESGFDVEVKLTVDGEEEWLNVQTYGLEKDAVRRAKSILNTITKWELDTLEMVSGVEVYHA